MNISKIAINNNVFTSKIKNKYTTNPLKNNFDNPNNSDKPDSLSILAYQNRSLIKSKDKSYSWELSNEQINNLKQKLKSCFNIKTLEDLLPDDRSLSYIFTHFFDYDSIIDSECFHCETKGSGLLFDKFKNFSKEEKETVFNSKLIDSLLKSSENKSFKLSVFDLPMNDVKNSYEDYTKDELTQHCLNDFVQDGIKDGLDAPIILHQFDKKIAQSVYHSFSHYPFAKEFYDLLEQRKCDDVVELTKIISSNVNSSSSKEEIDELYATLKKLLEAKTPDGNFIFGTSENKDTSSKNFLSGIEKILYAKNNDKNEYNKLMQLLQLTKDGTVPASVLGILASEGKIDDNFMELVIDNNDNSFIKDEDSAIVGDVVEKEDGLYFVCQNGLEKLDLSKETFNKLFPKIESMALSQGKNGNCYMVSALYDFIKNENARGNIFKMFSEDKNNIIVTIPDKKDTPIIFSKDFIADSKAINGSIGMQMLESAYAKTRINKNNSKDLSLIEGGQQSQVYNAFFGNNSAQFYTTESDSIQSSEQIEKILDELQKEIEETETRIKNLKDSKDWLKHLAYVKEQETKQHLAELVSYQRFYFELLNTTNNTMHLVSSDELIEKLINTSLEDNLVSVGTKPDSKNDSKMIAGSHAYSVLDIDKEKQTIDLINPWNTAQYVTLSFDEFKKYFNSSNVSNINQ